jgi:phosphoribosylformylglycinamidine synthase
MMACTIDEAIRRLMAVGGNFNHIGGLDNFCWPSIQFDPKKNPDGKFKAAQLVRACRALRHTCEAYEIPLLSGKDSMYVDGHLEGEFGERLKVSALETVQFSATSVVDDITKCVSMDPKAPGDLVYVLGETANELGASEFYEMFHRTGLNVPHVDCDKFKVVYRAVQVAIEKDLLASCHAVGRGGLGVHLAYSAMAGGLGLEVNLSDLPFNESRGGLSDETLLFSESAGRFIVTVPETNKFVVEKLFKGMPAKCVGRVTDQHRDLKFFGINREGLADLSIDELDQAFNKTFGDMI